MKWEVSLLREHFAKLANGGDRHEHVGAIIWLLEDMANGLSMAERELWRAKLKEVQARP